VFHTPTVQPSGVTYINAGNRVGLLVPRGTYMVSLTMNPSQGAIIDLLINGIKPTIITSLPSIYVGGIVDKTYIVQAPLKENNLVSFVNGGTSFFTVNDIPNTRIGNTAVTTCVKIARLATKEDNY